MVFRPLSSPPEYGSGPSYDVNQTSPPMPARNANPIILPSTGLPRQVTATADHLRPATAQQRMLDSGNAVAAQAANSHQALMEAGRNISVQPSKASAIVRFFRRIFGLDRLAEPKPLMMQAPGLAHEHYEALIKRINGHRKAGEMSKCREARRGLAGLIAADISGRTLPLLRAYDQLNRDHSQQRVIARQELALGNLLEYAARGAVADQKDFKIAVAEFRNALKVGLANHCINQFSDARNQFVEKVRQARIQVHPPPIEALREFAGALANLELQIPHLSNTTLSSNLDERMKKWNPLYNAAWDALQVAKQIQKNNLMANAKAREELTVDLENARTANIPDEIRIAALNVDYSRKRLAAAEEKDAIAVKKAEKKVKDLKEFLIDKSPEKSDQAFALAMISDARIVLMRGLKIHLNSLGKNLTANEKTVGKRWFDSVDAILVCEKEIKSIAEAGKFELPQSFFQKTKELNQQIDASAKARYKHFKPNLRDHPTEVSRDFLQFQLELDSIPEDERSLTIHQLIKAVTTDIAAIQHNRERNPPTQPTSPPPPPESQPPPAADMTQYY